MNCMLSLGKPPPALYTKEATPVPGHLKPLLFLASLGLLYFTPLLLHPTYVLYSDHSDFLATFLPAKHFLVRSWQQTGELPLWCPYSFGGMPFIHDVQVAAFYPFHWPLYLLPEEWLGPVMSWLVVVHVIIAGWCMFAYGRSQGLDETPALVAALGYMFAGKWLLHILEAGHYVLIPLAWLPLVLLWLEQAVHRRSFLRAAWSGVAFALIVLGTHPQMTFFAGLFIVLWTIGTVKAWDSFTQWLILGTSTALVAAALAAVQLLPALEAAPESTRAAGVAASDAAAVALPALRGLIGPGWSGAWEDRGCLGLLWVAAAVAAPLLCGRRVRFQACVCLILLFFSAGGAAFLQWLPGFRLFQLPVRMLLLLALPIAFLAGQTTQALLAGSQTRTVCRRVLFRVLGAGLLLAASDWLLHHENPIPPYWGVLLVMASATTWLLSDQCHLPHRVWAGAWLAVLLADSWALTWSGVAVRSADELYAPSVCVRDLAQAKKLAPHDHWRVLDRGLVGQPSSAPLGAALPMFGNIEIEPVLGYNPFDLRRYKEFLQFIMDEDQPIRPRDGIFGYPIVQGFPIRNKSLLDLLGTRYLLQPSTSSFDAEGEPEANPGWQKRGALDPQPAAYSFLAGGVQHLPAYQIYENPGAFPRAFVVHQCVPLAERSQVLAQMKTTDFRHEVLLEKDGLAAGHRPARVSDLPLNGVESATIREYLPNRVTIEVHAADAGYLVLTDVCFPGWKCTVDGEPTPIHRANFLFRAVPIRGGVHEIILAFQPASYYWGQRISIIAVFAVTGFSLLSGCCRRRPG
jgi:hypothetical protein